MADPRDPAAVPDDVPDDASEPDGAVPGGVTLDVRGGFDTDGDGLPDTVLTRTLAELLIHTDLDGDGSADRVLGIGPDGLVREVDPVAADPLVDGGP